jgi:hypothetical protein
MADSGNSTGIVAVLVIFVVVVLGGFLAVRSGVLGEGGTNKSVDVKVTAPSAPSAPAPAGGDTNR